MRLTMKWGIGVLVAGGLALLLSPAFGGGGSTPTFSLVGGEGVPGGSVGVTLALADDDGAAATAGVDIDFNSDDLMFAEPVSASCQIDDRLSATHQLAGRILPSGELNVEVLVLGTPDPIPLLGNGDLAVCSFTIRGDAMSGDMFPVGATNVFIGDALAGEIPSNAVDGVVTVGDATPTPEATATATPTPTGGPVCGDDRDCPTGQACTDGTCTEVSCEDDSTCPTGSTCQDGTCGPLECSDDSDCPPGSTCPELTESATTSGTDGTPGECTPIECSEDSECPERSTCDDNGECRPQFCDSNDDCEGDDVCLGDGICSTMCDDDSQCDNGVCVDGMCTECEDDSQCSDGVCESSMCVECRVDGDCDGGETCVSNTCQGSDTSYSLALSAPATGVAGGSAAVEVILSSDPEGQAADSVAASLAADSGLGLEACSVAAEVPGSVDGVPGSTASLALGDGDDSVPTGSIVTCQVSIAEDADGDLSINCSDATVNGAAVDCTSATISVQGMEPTATPTDTPRNTPTATPTEEDTPEPTARPSGDDDGCAVGPVSTTADPLANLLFLLVPAVLLRARRRR